MPQPAAHSWRKGVAHWSHELWDIFGSGMVPGMDVTLRQGAALIESGCRERTILTYLCQALISSARNRYWHSQCKWLRVFSAI